ncbi:MAG: sigma-70 family RNA polymerase sigma factor, partial [Clostridia bacterium]|nr:sigma-70 family RNA polymerase sigma factor [Clostridia bacterium]
PYPQQVPGGENHPLHRGGGGDRRRRQRRVGLHPAVLGSDPDSVSIGVEEENERDLLLRAVNRLEKREKQIMSLRFGLFGCEEHTQKEVADLLGISQSYISRLEKRILSKLKDELTHLS